MTLPETERGLNRKSCCRLAAGSVVFLFSIFLSVLFSFPLSVSGARAADASRENPVEATGCAFRAVGEARVAEIVDGDTVVLGDGRQVRLVGIQAPKLPLGRKGFVAWPLADEARDELVRLSAGKTVTLYRGDTGQDRHGRELAQLVTHEEKPVWLQAEMLRTGFARVYSFPDNRLCVDRLLTFEKDARARRAGIWALPYYAIRGAARVEELNALTDSFQLVEGNVKKAALVRGRLYLNFGERYQTDFTVTVPPRQVKLFNESEWADLLADRGGEMPLVGKRLRCEAGSIAIMGRRSWSRIQSRWNC